MDDRPDQDALSDFEALKRASVSQLLMRCARRVNEEGISRVREASGQEVRVAHTRLFPHIDFEGVRPTELAERAGVSKQAVGQLLRDMEEMGMVRRDRDPSDGRAVIVRYTARGLEALRHGMGVLAGLEQELALRLGEDRMARLREDLLALDQALDELEG